MSKELIEQAREAIDTMDDFARMANIVATGPLLVLNSAIDAFEAADKRIAELERCKSCGANGTTAPCAYPSERAKELERKLDVAREAMQNLVAVKGRYHTEQAYNRIVEALAQIGGEDE